MFFYISDNKEITKQWPLQFQHKFDKFVVYLDQGWNLYENILYKGYCVDQRIDVKVQHKDFSEQTGNYVILDFSNNSCEIHYDDSRSFPMYYNKNAVSNVEFDQSIPIWFDGTVYFNNNEWRFISKAENTFVYDPNHKSLNKTQIVDMYCDYLVTLCNKLDTDLPIYCADSKGVDSTVIRSAFDYCGRDYQLVENNSREKASLGWGYKQIYVTDEPHLQITGFCGDELLLRNPLYCQWLLDADNISLISEFDKLDYSYMKGFFNNGYRKKIQSQTTKFTNKSDGFNHTANVAVNDFQMWHTDNIITLTPYRNISIAIECLYADADAILDQVIHANISKEIINRLNPALLETVSKYKNNYK